MHSMLNDYWTKTHRDLTPGFHQSVSSSILIPIQIQRQ